MHRRFLPRFRVGLLVAAWLACALPSPSFARPCALRGAWLVQARCLLREVQPFGRLAPAQPRLPGVLEALIGRRVPQTRARLARRLRTLRSRRLAPLPRVLGGALRRLARARYFVIHDTSWPFYGPRPFPLDLRLPALRENQLRRWARGRRAHVFVDRRGESITALDFRTARRATKRERQVGRALRGTFLHIELVQPRRTRTPGPARNDAQAPIPGFEAAQYTRLAWLYVVASVRRGRWLIPAFHAALDTGIRGAHDDPQSFLQAAWAGEVARVCRLTRTCPPRRAHGAGARR